MEDFDQSTFDKVMELSVKELLAEAYAAGEKGDKGYLKYLAMGAESFDQVIEKMNQVMQAQIDAEAKRRSEKDIKHKADNKRERQNRKAGRK